MIDEGEPTVSFGLVPHMSLFCVLCQNFGVRQLGCFLLVDSVQELTTRTVGAHPFFVKLFAYFGLVVLRNMSLNLDLVLPVGKGT